MRPRVLLRSESVALRCNWKVAHDNTLDDYHVAIAHPTTLHREQGPVRHYRHALDGHRGGLALAALAGCAGSRACRLGGVASGRAPAGVSAAGCATKGL